MALTFFAFHMIENFILFLVKEIFILFEPYGLVFSFKGFSIGPPTWLHLHVTNFMIADRLHSLSL